MLDKRTGLYPIMLKDKYDGYDYIVDIPISRCIVLEDINAAWWQAKKMVSNDNFIIYARSCYYPNGRYKR